MPYVEKTKMDALIMNVDPAFEKKEHREVAAKSLWDASTIYLIIMSGQAFD